MNIVILAGGTGSIALQTGLYNLLDNHLEGVDTKILVNAYDDGLSTGQVRRVMGGHILGPSDVRKNQTTRLQLENPRSPWLKFLDTRFTIESTKVQDFCNDRITELECAIGNAVPKNIGEHYQQPHLHDAVEAYFKSPLATKIDYNDFSLANIIYAGLARANSNSLRKAASIMATLMGIKDNVLLNDDTSLFLGAITKNGRRINDEGDIVSWGNKDDPFVDVFFTNAEGANDTPVLCQEATSALLKADLIILSSGTQWSSLIPTYASSGFAETIEKCKAKILMIMNRQPDKDSPGQSASDIIELLVPKYFPEKSIHVITDKLGHQQMNSLTTDAQDLVASCSSFNLSPRDTEQSEKKHAPNRLANAIGRTFFRDFLDSDYFMFDYDDTLVGRGNVFPGASQANIAGLIALNHTLKIAVCTGNSIKALNIRGAAGVVDPETYEPIYKPLTVYADGGVNKYSYDTRLYQDNTDDGVLTELLECVDPSVTFKIKGPFGINHITTMLQEAGIPLSKIENRGDVMISIKPIDSEYRQIVSTLVRHLISDPNIIVKSTGRTTIEITHSKLSKTAAIKHIMNTENPKHITYVGDELRVGNDACVKGLNGLRCLEVSNPVKTAFFILTLSSMGQQ